MYDRLISIGDMAKLNNITIQTLRYYKKMGLVTPKYINKENNCRFYSIEQSSTIDIIKYLKDSNFFKCIPYFCSNNPASITRKKYLNGGNLYCDELFVYVEEDYCKNKLCLTEIPGGVYFCIYCDDITDEERYVYKLINYINENGIEIVGDLIQESLSDIIAIRENRKNLIMRIRIPIKFKK